MSNKVRKAGFETLKAHRRRLSGTTMRELFTHDPERFSTYSASLGDILLDYSKNRIDSQSMTALFDLARDVDVEGRRDDMWAGKPINSTEHRSVLHMALRYFGDDPVLVNGEDVMPAVRDVLARIKGFPMRSAMVTFVARGEISSPTWSILASAGRTSDRRW